MPAPFQLKIITRESVAYEGEVDSVMAPGTQGSLGVWYNHAPLITSLDAGALWFRQSSGSETTYQVKGGFLEVRDNVVTVLTDELTE